MALTVPIKDYRIYQTVLNKTLPDCTPDIEPFKERLRAIREEDDCAKVEQLWKDMGQAMPGAIQGEDGVKHRIMPIAWSNSRYFNAMMNGTPYARHSA